MKKDLDSILKDWASRNAADEASLDRIRRKVVTDYASRREMRGSNSHFSLWFKLKYVAVGAAAVLAVVFVRFYVAPTPVPRGDTPVARYSSIPASDVDAHRRLFSEMDRLFDRALVWVAQANGEVNVGVESDEPGGATGSPVLVRVTVARRLVGEQSWTPAWQTDVIVRDQQVVEVAPDRNNDNQVRIWVYSMAEGKLAVETDLSLSSPLVLRAAQTTVVDSGMPAEVGVFMRAGVEYRVLQTAVALQEGSKT